MARKIGWHPFLGNKTECDMCCVVFVLDFFFAFQMRFGLDLDTQSTCVPSRTHVSQIVDIVILFPIVRPIREKNLSPFAPNVSINLRTLNATKNAQLQNQADLPTTDITSFGDDVNQ